MPERIVRAAGGVLWRRVGEQREVALVHRPRYDDWSLPKGKLDPDEPWVVGAVREVLEETGFMGAPGRTLGESRYRVLDRGRDVPKVVRWWAMRCLGGAFVPSAEVDGLRWLPAPVALAQATGGYDSEPLQAFLDGPAETTTVLLVRTESRCLPAYGPDRVLVLSGAPVPGAVLRLGLPVQDGGDDLQRLLHRLSGEAGTAVVCAPPHPDGSRALSFAQGRLVDTAVLD